MNKEIIRTFGFGGTGFLPLRFFEGINYHGKIRIWNLNGKMYGRPQNLFFDIVQIMGTHTFEIFKFDIVII